MNGLLDRFRTPEPPPELRARALRAARAAAGAEPGEHGWRPFDLAWATAAALLLVAHVALSLARPPASRATAESGVRPGPCGAELAGELGLPHPGSARDQANQRPKVRLDDVLRAES